MTRFADHIISTADVLASSSEDGDVRVNLGIAVSGKGITHDSPWWANGDGFLSRPNDPDDTGSCEALYAFNGNQKVAITARDARYYNKAGALKPGDRAIVSRGEARIMLKATNDSVTLYTTNQTDGDTSMLVSLIGDNGKVLISNGGAYIEMKKDKIVLSAGGTMLVLDSNGLAVFGAHTALNTKSGNLGVLGAIAPPAPANSILFGTAGAIGLPAPFWTVAPA